MNAASYRSIQESVRKQEVMAGDEPRPDHNPHPVFAPTSSELSALPPLDVSTPVVLLQGLGDPVPHGMLAAARSLGRLGVPVFAVFRSLTNAVRRSRYVRAATNIEMESEPGNLPDLLLALTGGNRPPLVVPVDDAAMLHLSDVPHLQELCIIPAQSPDSIRRLSDKRELHGLVQHPEIRVPLTRMVSTHDELLRAAREFGYPAVLKTAVPRRQGQGSRATSVCVAMSERNLLARYNRFDPQVRSTALLQEYIPGNNAVDWIFNGYFDRESKCQFAGTGVKIRQLPLRSGAATLGVCMPNEILEQASISLAAACGYTGMLDIDYRYDDRDGTYKLLDINPRLGGSFRLFVSDSGTDVVRAYYRDSTGQPVQVARARYGRKWLVEQRDLRSSFSLMRSGQLKPGEWLRSLKGVEEFAWLDRSDMRPFFAMLRHYVSRSYVQD